MISPQIESEIQSSELEAFASAEIEEVEELQEEQVHSILESLLFASDKPVSFLTLKAAFRGTNVDSTSIKRALEQLSVEFAGAKRGVVLEEISGGYQLRTKPENQQFLARSIKSRPFRLSGPALEVLAIVAYKQPLIKAEIDQIRGVESGHLLRALMEKNLVAFEGKSDLPGKPMQYRSTRKFLEVFGLRNLRELPTLSQIDELLPEGVLENEIERAKLSDVTDQMGAAVAGTYSVGEEELEKIASDLAKVQVTKWKDPATEPQPSSSNDANAVMASNAGDAGSDGAPSTPSAASPIGSEMKELN